MLFSMLLRGFRFIAACTIGLIGIKGFRQGLGSLEVVGVFVSCLHASNAVLRHTSNCLVASRLLVPTVFKATIRSRVASDAILLEVMSIDERNNRHVCIRQTKRIFVYTQIFVTNYKSG